MKSIRFLTGGLTLLALSYAGFAFYVLNNDTLDGAVLCATGHRVFYIPELACQQYVLRFAEKRNQHERDTALVAALFSAFEGRAGEKGRQKAFKLASSLLKLGANINATSPYDGYTPLHGAVLANAPDQVHYLLQMGADPDVRDQTSRQQTVWEFIDWLESDQQLDRQEARRALGESSTEEP